MLPQAGRSVRVGPGRRHLNHARCIPTKALVRAAEIAEDDRQAAEFGIGLRDMEVDFAAVMERVQRVIGEGVAFYEHQIARDEGITLFRGHARFLDEHRIDRDGETLEFEHALIAGGAPPHVPDLPGVVRSPIHDFHLFGPGVNKKTSVQNMGSATWTVRLTRGVSRYRCDPHRAIVHGSFTVS